MRRWECSKVNYFEAAQTLSLLNSWPSVHRKCSRNLSNLRRLTLEGTFSRIANLAASAAAAVGGVGVAGAAAGGAGGAARCWCC